jgi:drug/metabolite transporter superfamily protein YnfA
MNQFRDILMAVLIVLGMGVLLTDPHDWTWAAHGGPYVVNSLNFLADYKPWTPVILFALSLALFMTRIKY